MCAYGARPETEPRAHAQFYKRLLLFWTDSTRLSRLTEDPGHDSYLDSVPMPVILKFTACQLAGLLICYGITWAGIAGISFPVRRLCIEEAVSSKQRAFLA